MKRMIAFCLLMVIASALVLPVLARETPAPPAAEETQVVPCDCFCPEHKDGSALYIPGDPDKNGQVNAADALSVLRHCVGAGWQYRFPEYASGRQCCAIYCNDVSGDEVANAKDALLILQYAVGKIDSFPRAASRPAPVTPTDA